MPKYHSGFCPMWDTVRHLPGLEEMALESDACFVLVPLAEHNRKKIPDQWSVVDQIRLCKSCSTVWIRSQLSRLARTQKKNVWFVVSCREPCTVGHMTKYSPRSTVPQLKTGTWDLMMFQESKSWWSATRWRSSQQQQRKTTAPSRRSSRRRTQTASLKSWAALASSTPPRTAWSRR